MKGERMFVSTHYPLTPSHVFIAFVQYPDHMDVITAGTYEPFTQAVKESIHANGMLVDCLFCEPWRMKFNTVYATQDGNVNSKRGISFAELCTIAKEQQAGKAVIETVEAYYNYSYKCVYRVNP